MEASILAIETSSEQCSLALQVGESVRYFSSEQPRGHADNILPMAEQALSELGIGFADLDVIAVTRGPGAFTSVRIGTAVAQGLALGTGCKVVLASSLEVLALGAMEQSQQSAALVALDARMGEVYFGIYQRADDGTVEALQPDQVVSPETVDIAAQLLEASDSWASAGRGWAVYPDALQKCFNSWTLIPVAMQYPSARDLLTIARVRHQSGQWVAADEIIPVYLRDQVVSV